MSPEMTYFRAHFSCRCYFCPDEGKSAVSLVFQLYLIGRHLLSGLHGGSYPVENKCLYLGNVNDPGEHSLCDLFSVFGADSLGSSQAHHAPILQPYGTETAVFFHLGFQKNKEGRDFTARHLYRQVLLLIVP